MIEIIAIILFISSSFLAFKVYKLSNEVSSLSTALVNEYTKNYSDDDLVKEQFLKFVSDSREWAFEYIENVQLELSKIVDEINPAINNEKEFNHKKTLESVYTKLQTLLPEQDK